jgi:two-component system, chemotaxis family, CheB/CheR fusion protein
MWGGAWMPHEKELQESGTGVWYEMRVRPYKTWDNKIDGAVISFDNIDAFKRNVEHLNRYAAALIENARDANLVLDSNLHVVSANQAFQRSFEVSAEGTENRPIYDLGNGQWNIPRLRELLENILSNNGRVEDFEVHHDFPHLGPRTMMVNARRIELQAGRPLILLYIEDVTQRPKQNM